jgi:Ni/Fe-hydrogenase subunit HybB-like protein
MHQSSLGSLLLLAGPRLHPLWNTPWLPLLFLMSCIFMGYAALIFEATLSRHFFNRPWETPMLGKLSYAMTWVLAAFGGFRLAELAFRGQLARLSLDQYTFFFLLEMALLAAPLGILVSRARRYDPRHLFVAAMLLMLAGGLYRLDTFLIAFSPGTHWSYFPSVPELLFTIGLLALEVVLYVLIVKKFPILSGWTSAPARAAAA